MKKIIAWLPVLALTAAISIGATLAYLTDTDEDVNVMTVGKVKIDQLEYERVNDETSGEDAEVREFHDNKPLYPGVYNDDFKCTDTEGKVDWTQIGKDDYSTGIWNPEKFNNELDKMVFVKNKGTYDAYVRTIFAFEAGNYETLDEFKAMMHLNLNTTNWSWEWQLEPVSIGGSKYFVAVATYNDILEPGALTEISLSQIALDKTATNADVEAFGETYNVLVKTQAIQADGFETAAIALDEGFKPIDAFNIPFETDEQVVGADLKAALHYLNADPAGTAITGSVTNVTFGLTKAYPEIVNGYDGVLTDAEQDVPVYTYYVPNGSGYDVYMLSNSTIYAPKDSNGLFRNMKALKTLNTDNLDFSRTETMRNMVRDCQSLVTLDVSDWDTSKVNDMAYMFQNCYKLKEIAGLTNWDVSNVTTMLQTFAFCKVLPELDVSGWDVSNVTSMVGTFGQCFELKKLDTTGWKPLSVTSTQNMFYNCYALTDLVGSGGWVMPKVTAVNSMFQSCTALTYLDATSWDLSSAENMYSTFWKCYALKEIEGTENWNVGNVTNFFATFEYCNALEDLDVSTWDTGSATDMADMFFDCYSLETLDVSNWDTSNVTAMQAMFSCEAQNGPAMKFKTLPVENWDVSKVTHMGSMFYGCGQLTELDLSNWDTSSLTNLRHTFADCFKLEKIDFTGWDTSKVWNFDGMFNDCMALKELDLSSFDTGSATTFGQFFEGCASLKTVKGMENWDTSKVTNMEEMFNANSRDMHLEYVDLSAFDTSNVIAIYSMFNGCYRLQTVYVGDGWDMSKVTSSGSMFSGCSALVGANGTTTSGNPTDATYARVDEPAVRDDEGNVITEAVPGLLTHINDKPVTP